MSAAGRVGLPAGVVCVSDYEPLARQVMTDNAWAYVSGGAADELTLRWNREAFDRIRLAPRVLADFADASTAVTLFGRALAYPILLAPTAFQRLSHPDGEHAMVEGAGAMGAIAVVSTNATILLEDLAARATGPLWFQLYVQADRPGTRQLIGRAERAGYEALVVTVDAPVNGVRDRECRAGFHLPDDLDSVNLREMSPVTAKVPSFVDSPLFSGALEGSATWRDIEWIRGLTRLPVLLKGILTPDDAARGVAAGADGIIVSNHGGRTLDTVPATIDVLPAVVARVGASVPVLVDGGIRRGTDVLKSLALGASAVLVGRPYVYGMAVAGALGVAHVLQMLRAELETAMVLTGCPRIVDVDGRVIVGEAGTTGASGA